MNGLPHTIVKTPATEIGTGTRYAVVHAWTDASGFFLTTSGITATHDDSPIDVNITIDSFPASVTFNDQLVYQLRDDGYGGYQFVVRQTVYVNVLIDIGDPIWSLSK